MNMNINHNIIEIILFIVHQQGITWQGKAELYEITEIIETQHAWMWNLQTDCFFLKPPTFLIVNDPTPIWLYYVFEIQQSMPSEGFFLDAAWLKQPKRIQK